MSNCSQEKKTKLNKIIYMYLLSVFQSARNWNEPSGIILGWALIKIKELYKKTFETLNSSVICVSLNPHCVIAYRKAELVKRKTFQLIQGKMIWSLVKASYQWIWFSVFKSLTLPDKVWQSHGDFNHFNTWWVPMMGC